jgi:phospholipase/carboxylesterase
VSLGYRERPAAGEPEGALVLFHGRGADEHDLFPLLDELDPDRRLHGYTPRGPLALPPGGAHWYALGGIPTPDPATFWPTYERAGAWLDALPHERIVLGGFSQGAVMSYALGLRRGRPRPAAILAFSGFVPRVDGLELDLDGKPPMAVGHGTFDPVIPIEFGREARDLLQPELYREYPLPHAIDPRFLDEAHAWLRSALERPAKIPT